MKSKIYLKNLDSLLKWLAVFLWAIVIFTLSQVQQLSVSEFFFWDFVAKKVLHVSEYAILFTLLFRATRGKYLMSYFLTFIYAVSDELHQKFVPGRNATFFDLAFDTSGANIASYIIWRLRQHLLQKQKKLRKN